MVRAGFLLAGWLLVSVAGAGMAQSDGSAVKIEPAAECSACTARHKGLQALQQARAPKAEAAAEVPAKNEDEDCSEDAAGSSCQDD